MRDFLFGHIGVWTRELWISNPALYHCATVTSGFQLWQFQVYISGAEELVVVLFWLDLWEIFFLATLGFEPGTSGSLVLHSTSAPRWLLVFTSDNFRYLTLVQRDWWWYCSDWTCPQIFFLATPGFELNNLWISSPALYPCAMATSGFHLWQFQEFNSGAEGLMLVLFWLDLWEIFFLATLGFEPNDLWISSPALYHCAMAISGFHLWQFQVFNSGAEGLVVVLFWLDLWEIFFLVTLGFEPETSGSLVLHSTTVPWRLLVFTSDNFRYLTLVQRDWCWYCSDWTCQNFLFGHTVVWTQWPLDL